MNFEKISHNKFLDNDIKNASETQRAQSSRDL